MPSLASTSCNMRMSSQKQLTLYIIIGAIALAILIALLVWWLMRRRMHVREEALQATINALRNEKTEYTY